jgi:FKBP-type peptidyl-prolyl cis-trans isomerase 2
MQIDITRASTVNHQEIEGQPMCTIAERDIIAIAFTGKLDNGEIFIEVPPKKPMTLKLGESELPPTVELGVIGLKKGEKKKIRVSPDEGYGPRLKDLLHEVDKEHFTNRLEPKPGMLLSQKVERDGIEQQVPVTVIEVRDDKVVLDYNHPLAGHHLTYDLEIIDIIKPD